MSRREPDITIIDPTDVRVGRVEVQDEDRIRQEYEFTFEDKPFSLVIYSKVDAFGSYVVALLNALGFPQGDLDYVAERLIKEAGRDTTTQHHDA